MAAAAEGKVRSGDSVLDWLSFAVSILGILGALIAFGVGLYQYRRAQQWKRTEFVAKEIKELLQDRRATAALAMIDWASRDIRLHATLDPRDGRVTRVTRDMQCLALRPHSIKEGSANAAADFEVSRDGDQLRSYSEVETLIRDCYDALLDRYDRLGSCLDRSLLRVGDLSPYIGYYLDDIAKPTKDPAEAMWCVAFLTYVHFYKFLGVRSLFEAFHHNINPDGAIFTGFLDQVGADKNMAIQLQAAARREYEDSIRKVPAPS